MTNICRTFALVLPFLALAQLSIAQAFHYSDPTGEPPDLTCHVVHYRIEVSLDDSQKSVTGIVTITLVPFSDRLDRIEFDAEQMKISAVTLQGHSLAYSVSEKTLSISLDHPYSWRDTLAITISYTCTPTQGLYFVDHEPGTPGERRQIWSQGEDMYNHFWFPCHDFPNDKSTSEILATVRNPYTLVSNGRLIDVKHHPENGTTTFHWREDLPHASYLIMLAAGEYSILHDQARTTPLTYYVYPGQESDAQACFSETPAIMKFFSNQIGVPYPWNKYAQVEIADFMWGGMENTSATTLSDEIIIFDSRARVDDLPTDLIAHEMAHQWWGDLVTCRDWRHLWLNESFASYFDPLYFESTRGRDEFDMQMLNAQRRGINSDKAFGRKPVVSAEFNIPNLYPRGASILHMLRFVLGDSLFWRSLHHYITKYQFQSVETNDFKNAIEETTGQNLYWFFDEWLYRAGHPVFSVSYDWVDSLKILRLNVRQDQPLDSLTGVFRMPVDVEITTERQVTTHRLEIHSRDSVFTLPCMEKPRLVIFDKGNWILKELAFDKPREEWLYQALHAPRAVDRILAINHFTLDLDREDGVPVLCELLLHDSFYGVRRQAAMALGELFINNDSLQRAKTNFLAQACSDSNPHVRLSAMVQLRTCHGDAVLPAVYKGLRDSSYNIVASSLKTLALVDSSGAVDTLQHYVNVPSRHDVISTAALQALASVDSNRAIGCALSMTNPSYPSERRYAALQVLRGFTSARDTLLGMCREFLHDRNNRIRSKAIGLLGEFGEASAIIPLLEPIAADKTNASSEDAQKSIERLKNSAHSVDQ